MPHPSVGVGPGRVADVAEEKREARAIVTCPRRHVPAPRTDRRNQDPTDRCGNLLALLSVNPEDASGRAAIHAGSRGRCPRDARRCSPAALLGRVPPRSPRPRPPTLAPAASPHARPGRIPRARRRRAPALPGRIPRAPPRRAPALPGRIPRARPRRAPRFRPHPSRSPRPHARVPAASLALQLPPALAPRLSPARRPPAPRSSRPPPAARRPPPARSQTSPEHRTTHH
jgi:hypothetical protein